jgi:hypothetical protein
MTRRALLLVLALLAVAVAPGLGFAADTTEPAGLAISQPHYVDSDVRTDTSGDTPTYLTEGRVQLITPQNFDPENVTDYGIREAEGELTYDEDHDVYVLDTKGVNGTFNVYWEAETTRQVETTENNTTSVETVTETTRYEAAIQSDGTELRHVEPSLIERYRADAENWSVWESTICDITGGSSCDIETETQQAANLMKVSHQPWALFSGGIVAALTILFLRPGGLLLVAVDKTREYFANKEEREMLNEIESLDSDRAEIEEQLDKMDRAQRERQSARRDIGEVVDNPYLVVGAREAYGDSVHAVHTRFNSDTRDVNIAHDRLQAMGLAGYSASMDYDEDSDAWELHVHEPVDGPHKTQPGTMLSEFDSKTLRRLLPRLDVDQTFIAFDPTEHDIDRDQLETKTELPATVEELAEQYREQEFEFPDGDSYAKCMYDLFRDVERTPLTNDDGELNTVRDRLSCLFRFEGELEDQHPLPLTTMQRHRLGKALELHDPAETARTNLKHSQEGRNV